ncbi:hypothetical protein Tco_0733077 [Tanacetum coccineum]
MKAEFKNEVQTTMRNQSNELKNDVKNMISSFFQVFGFVSKSNNWTNNGNKKVDNKKYGNNVNIGNNRGPNPNFLCKNYGKVGHTIGRCFDLIGYPPGYNKNPGPKQNGFKSFNANSASTSNENGTSLSFTNEQMMKLMNIINEVPSGNMHANIASRASFFNRNVFFNINFKIFFNSNSVMYNITLGWIIDSGANQHMTISTVNMFGIIDIYDLNLTVGHPNEIASQQNHGDWLGHPSDQVVDVLISELNFTKDSHVSPRDICHKAKQTREPFPLSDHKTSAIGELVHVDL